MKKIVLILMALLAISVMANAQYAKSSVVDGPIKYKYGNYYDANGQIIKGQESVIAYLGSDNYFNIYEKAHKKYKTGAIVSTVGIGLFTAGCIIKKPLEGDAGAFGTYGTVLRIWSYPTMLIGGLLYFKNNGRLKQLAKEYNYNYKQKSSLSFGATDNGVGFAYIF